MTRALWYQLKIGFLRSFLRETFDFCRKFTLHVRNVWDWSKRLESFSDSALGPLKQMCESKWDTQILEPWAQGIMRQNHDTSLKHLKHFSTSLKLLWKSLKAFLKLAWTTFETSLEYPLNFFEIPPLIHPQKLVYLPFNTLPTFM